MEMLQVFLWIIYPYMVGVIFMIGLVWRCDLTELYEDNQNRHRRIKLFRWGIKGLMILSAATGVTVLLLNGLENDSSHLFHWFVSLILLHPDIHFISDISILSRMHILVFLTFLLMLSFTQYINYILNPFLLYKKLNIISHE